MPANLSLPAYSQAENQQQRACNNSVVLSSGLEFQKSQKCFDWHIPLLGTESSEERGFPPRKSQEAYSSPAFALQGHGPCYLHFMPYVSGDKGINGGDAGYGGLFLEAPNGCGLRFVLALGKFTAEFEGHWTAKQRWHGGCLLLSRAEVLRTSVGHGFDARVEVIQNLGSLRPYGGSGAEWIIPDAAALAEQARKGEAIMTRHFVLDSLRNIRLRLYPQGDKSKACPEGCAAVHIEAPVGSKLSYTLTVHGASVWKKTTEEVFNTSRIGCVIGPLQPLCSREGELTIRLKSLPFQCTGTVGNVDVMGSSESYTMDEKEIRIEWVIENAQTVLGPLRRGQYVRSTMFDAGEKDPWQLVLYPRANLGCEKLPGDEEDVDYACHPGSNLGSMYLQSVKRTGQCPLPSGLKCRWFAGKPNVTPAGNIVDNILVGGIDREPGRGYEDEEATTLRRACASHGIHEVCNFFDLINPRDGTLTLGVHVSGHILETSSDVHVREIADRLKSINMHH